MKGRNSLSKKLTTEDYKKKLKEARGNDVVLLSEYNGSTKPIRVRFTACGHEVTINKPYNLLNGSNCIICKDQKRRMATKKFKKRLKQVLGTDYQLVGEYKNSRTKVTMKHLVCSRTYKTRPENPLNGLGCPYCSKKTMWTTDKFKKKLADKYGNEYKVLGEYTGSSNKIKIEHTVCGNVWEPTPNNLLSERSHCPKCTATMKRELERLDVEVVKERIYKVSNGQLVVTDASNYKNSNFKITYKCEVCGYIGKANAGNLMRGAGCPNCANKSRNKDRTLTINEIKRRTIKMTNHTYVCLGGKYQNSNTLIWFKHLECGAKFKTSWSKFSRGAVKCPHCRGSRGEQLVKGYLDQYQINYKFGYVIPDLMDKKRLHFDFWLPQYNVAIEYDGVQHYRVTQFKYSDNQESNFAVTKKHDKMKDQYCKDKGINLIRIPYYEDVNDLLDQELLSYID